MKPNPKARAKEFEVRIEKLVYGGSGLGRHEGQVVFVPFTAPGDLVRVRATEWKKNFVRARAVEVLEPGPGRQIHACAYFGSCGGCQWQHLEYGSQLEFKRKILEEAFHHNLPETRELAIGMTGSPQSFGYRSRARVQMRGFGAGATVGLYRTQSHRVEDVESCPLFHPSLNAALSAVRAERRSKTSDPGVHELDLACSPDDETWRIAAVGAAAQPDASPSPAAEGRDAEETIFRRTVGAFSYLVTPAVFFQANHLLAGELVDLVSELARAGGRAAALDLFSGVGLFVLPLAGQFAKVTAVESSPLACRLCAENAVQAGLENVRPICAEVSSWMDAAGSLSPPAFDLVVLNPPRTGAGKHAMEKLIEWTPERIVYISCDPQTLVRDLVVLSPRHYRIDFVQGLDMFPHTYHFETIVRLLHR